MRKFRSITLAELRSMVDQAIAEHGTETQVAFVCEYGDYARTPQALPFPDTWGFTALEESAYSQSGFATADADPTKCLDCGSRDIAVQDRHVICGECEAEYELDATTPPVVIFRHG